MNYNYNTPNPYSSNIPGLLGQGQQGIDPRTGAPIGRSRPKIWGLPGEQGNPMNDLVYNNLAKQAMKNNGVPWMDGIGSTFFPPEVRQLGKEDATKYLNQYYSSYKRPY